MARDGRASLKTNGPRFSAARMVNEYAERIWPVGERDPPRPVSDSKSDTSRQATASRDGTSWTSTTSSTEEPGAHPEDGVERAGHVAHAAEHERRDGADRVADAEHQPDERGDPLTPLLEVERQRHHEREHPALRDAGEKRPEVSRRGQGDEPDAARDEDEAHRR